MIMYTELERTGKCMAMAHLKVLRCLE